MKINKILNNNVVISQNKEKKEIIVLGCGIAFKKKIGESIDETLIEKIFIASDKNTKKKITTLLDEIPLKYIHITDKITKYTKEKFKKEISDTVYVALADHIYRGIERFVSSGEIFNGLLWDIKRLYPKEFEVGIYALQVIREVTKIQMPEDEAAFIATHIVNAQLNENIPTIINLTKLVTELTNIIKYNLFLEVDTSLISYERFINHLKFLGQKILKKDIGENNSSNDELFILVTEKYPKEKECVEKIQEFLEKRYNYQIQIDEMLFLIIHIVKIKNEILQKNS